MFIPVNEERFGAHSWLLEYYNKCQIGERIIGYELRTELDNLIKDLENPNYRFVLKKPHTRIKFIETKLKHFEAPFAGQPFILELEQKAIAEAIFGYEIYDEETCQWIRRITEILLLIARKNGKTPFTAALILSEWFCGEAGQKVMCASNDYEQASLIFDCINNMREESVSLERVTRKNNFGIFFGNPKQQSKRGKFSKQNKGSIKKISSRAGSAGSGTKEGRNLKIVVADEVHAMQDDSMIMPLRQSLSTQIDPLFFEITTEGMVQDGYLDNRLKIARQVLNGEIDRPRWLIWLYTQDNESEIWQDKQSWYKSNPFLRSIKKWSYLEGMVEEAKTSSSKRAFVLSKEFNIKQNSAQAWLPKEIIINAEAPKWTLEDFRNHWCIAGVDLSETTDLTACTLLFLRKDINIKYAYTMYFIPRAKVEEEKKYNQERKDYERWAEEGLIKIVEGNIIDDDIVAKWLREVFKVYNIIPYRVGYDQWHAKTLVDAIKYIFGSEAPNRVQMDAKELSNPMHALEADMRSRLLNYNNNEICVWNFENTGIKINSYGLIMPVKMGGYVGNKIDGTMSKIIAYATLRKFKAEFMLRVT